MASIRIRGVRKSFGAAEVMHGINIDVTNGEFVALVGPSGCGKSTLLRMVAGLEDVSSGEIHIDGRVVNDVPAKERDIAMVFQNYALYPHMTVAANMSFSLRLRKVAAEEIDTSVMRAAEILGLSSVLKRYPRELSGGQRQRVAMGRAIVRDPKVFLFDEPLSNLDAKLRVAMRTEIKELHQQLKSTVLYVTHDQIEAMTMADRIVVMNGGIIEQIGTPLDLYDKPGNLFVATFIGSPSMNMHEGEVVDSPTRVRVADDFFLDVPQPASVTSGQKVVAGIRPEHITLADDGIEAAVRLVEPTGAETQVLCEVGTQQVLAIARERRKVRPGERVRLRINAADVHLFDAQSGQRLSCGGAS